MRVGSDSYFLGPENTTVMPEVFLGLSEPALSADFYFGRLPVLHATLMPFYRNCPNIANAGNEMIEHPSQSLGWIAIVLQDSCRITWP
jgi:hypothetical protein